MLFYGLKDTKISIMIVTWFWDK